MDNQLQILIADKTAKAKEIFDQLDVSEATRAGYKTRIGLFLKFTQENGFKFNY